MQLMCVMPPSPSAQFCRLELRQGRQTVECNCRNCRGGCRGCRGTPASHCDNAGAARTQTQIGPAASAAPRFSVAAGACIPVSCHVVLVLVLVLALVLLPESHALWRTFFADVRFIVDACLQLQPPKASLRQIQAQEETDAMME
jgi:hypothetical protein